MIYNLKQKMYACMFLFLFVLSNLQIVSSRSYLCQTPGSASPFQTGDNLPMSKIPGKMYIYVNMFPNIQNTGSVWQTPIDRGKMSSKRRSHRDSRSAYSPQIPAELCPAHSLICYKHRKEQKTKLFTRNKGPGSIQDTNCRHEERPPSPTSSPSI